MKLPLLVLQSPQNKYMIPYGKIIDIEDQDQTAQSLQFDSLPTLPDEITTLNF